MCVCVCVCVMCAMRAMQARVCAGVRLGLVDMLVLDICFLAPVVKGLSPRDQRQIDQAVTQLQMGEIRKQQRCHL